MSPRNRRWAWVALGVVAAAAVAQPASQPQGAEDGGYVWNEMQGEKLIALGARGDALRGEITYEVCQGCHRSHALGRSDGSYPRLAGQHVTVLIKQMTDVRAGRRKNEKMLPFIDQHVVNPQDIADIAVYLTRLPSPPNHGRGRGDALSTGEQIYRARCSECHGRGGEGDAAKFYPRLNGQHYKYMVREMFDIRSGLRGNSNPRMREVVRTMTDAEVEAACDYVSRLPTDPAR